MTTPVSFILLGGTSDLAMRLLLPGVGEVARATGRTIELIGAGRRGVDDYQAQVDEAAGTHIDVQYVAGDATSGEYLRSLFGAASHPRVIVYFALAPAVSVRVIEAMQGLELPADLAFAMEKPYGNSAAEADELDRTLHSLAGEDAIYRVDHFLSEPAVNRAAALVATEGAPEELTFVYEEDLGLEGRAEFYESTGAAEDMVQSHLIQSAARILAGGPQAATVLDVLGSFELVPGSVRRGRYRGYTDEDGVDPANETETLVECELQAPGTRVRLRTGKGFAQERKHVQGIALYDGPFSPYGNVIRALFARDHTAFVPQGGPQHGWRLMEDIAAEMAHAPMEEY